MSSWVKHDVREAYSRLLRVCNSLTMWQKSFKICIQLFLYLTSTISRDICLFIFYSRQIKKVKMTLKIARLKLSLLCPLCGTKYVFPEIEDRNSICIFNRRHRSLYCIEIVGLKLRVHIFHRIHSFKGTHFGISKFNYGWNRSLDINATFTRQFFFSNW